MYGEGQIVGMIQVLFGLEMHIFQGKIIMDGTLNNIVLPESIPEEERILILDYIGEIKKMASWRRLDTKHEQKLLRDRFLTGCASDQDKENLFIIGLPFVFIEANSVYSPTENYIWQIEKGSRGLALAVAAYKVQDQFENYARRYIREAFRMEDGISYERKKDRCLHKKRRSTKKAKQIQRELRKTLKVRVSPREHWPWW